jgi:hypothetical protein
MAEASPLQVLMLAVTRYGADLVRGSLSHWSVVSILLSHRSVVFLSGLVVSVGRVGLAGLPRSVMIAAVTARASVMTKDGLRMRLA